MCFHGVNKAIGFEILERVRYCIVMIQWRWTIKKNRNFIKRKKEEER